MIDRRRGDRLSERAGPDPRDVGVRVGVTRADVDLATLVVVAKVSVAADDADRKEKADVVAVGIRDDFRPHLGNVLGIDATSPDVPVRRGVDAVLVRPVKITLVVGEEQRRAQDRPFERVVLSRDISLERELDRHVGCRVRAVDGTGDREEDELSDAGFTDDVDDVEGSDELQRESTSASAR